MSVTGVSLVTAFAGGVASFASPCVLPLVPAYLAIVGGLDVALPSDATGSTMVATRRRHLGRLTRDTLLFIVGFGVVFVVLGLSASAVGRAVIHQQALLTRLAGVLIEVMALFLAGTVVLRTPSMYREWRPHPQLARLGPFAAPVAGAAFAFGWTPCVGPILASVLALSTQQGHTGSAAVLLSVYSLGLGAPFLAVAVFFDRLQRPMTWLKRHGSAVTIVSALVLGILGILLVLDRLAWVTTLVQHLG